MLAQITNIGQDGKENILSQGIGIGVRQHDDVMLSYGYSKKTWLEITIPGGDTAVIKITVPANIQHHAEGRILSSTEENLRVRVLKDAVDGEFPLVVSTMPVVNQREDFNVNKLTNFEYCGNVSGGAIPSTGEEQSNFPLYVSAGGFFSPTVVGENKSIKGRYSSEGLKAILIENTGTGATTVYYQYDWHEFE